MIPQVQRALLVAAKGQTPTVSLQRALPKLNKGDVLLKVKAVTLNPTDWKHHDRGLKPGTSFGSDFAGEVVEVGSEVKGFKVGDAVAGFTRGGVIDELNGSFQEYIKSPAELVWHKPSSIDWADAASMGGIALSTSALVLYDRLSLPFPDAKSASPQKPIIVWAGSTSVGLFAIHLAKLSGVPVVTTASPRNFDLVKSLGAEAVFDYKDPDVAEKIRAYVKEKGYGGFQGAYDCVSEHGSTVLIAKALGETGGKIVTLIPIDAPEGGWPPKVELNYTLVYYSLDPKENDYKWMSAWNKKVPSLVTEYGLKNAIPLKNFGSKLEDIPEGLELLKQGKVSGSKIAYTFA